MQGPKPYVRRISLDRSRIPGNEAYPWHIPAVRALNTLEFHPDVTFLVGENGSGKSTLIEAIAVALGFNAEGGNKNTVFHTQQTHSALHTCLKLSRSYAKPSNGYFLRAESFYNPSC